MEKKKGFTFIETLIVIGIIALLAVAVFVSINPGKRFESTHEKQREIHVQSILTAIYQYRATKGEDCLGIPDETKIETVDGEDKEVPYFKNIGTTSGEDYYDLYDCLTPFYLDKPLLDPKEGTLEDSKYQIWKNPHTGRVTVLSAVNNDIFAGPEIFILSAPETETIDPDEEWPEEITHYSARAGGNVTDEGGAHVWESGVVWNEADEGEPKNNWESHMIISSGMGSFSTVISGLNTDTVYNIQAYARNDIGTGYGQSVSFKTLDAMPGVRTLEENGVTHDQATLQGEVTSLGPGVSSVYRYFKWMQGRQADYNEEAATHTPSSLGSLGDFDYTLYASDGLETDNYYSFQACAENSYGERCGAVEEFYTQASPPLVTTEIISKGAYEATLGGEVTNTGGSQVFEWGVCFSSAGVPVYPDDCQQREGAEDEPFNFEIDVSSLEPGTDYLVFAYAKNTEDRRDGETLPFTTDKVAPILEPVIIGAHDHNSAEFGVDIRKDGGASITSHGICWSVGGMPALPSNCESWEGGEVGIFTYTLKNFLAGTTYNIRAFAINEKGTGYSPSPLQSFTTDSPAEAPQLGSTEVIEGSITQTSAELKGIIQNHGGAQIVDHGFCWSKQDMTPTPENPPPGDEGGCEEIGSLAIGVVKEETNFEFTFTVTGLSMGTEYYGRAFAQNEKGYGYGWSVGPPDFRTHDPYPPSVTTDDPPPTDIIGTTAKSGGEISNDGGDPETVGGICYSFLPESTYPPREGDPDCTEDIEGKGVFTSQMTGLVGGETYYYRAYASNPADTVYGEEYSFVAGSEQGDECSINDDCRTKLCVDGYCCDKPCLGTCEACDLAGSEGTCTNVPNGQDPHNDCGEKVGHFCNNICSMEKFPGCDGNGECLGNITESAPQDGYVCHQIEENIAEWGKPNQAFHCGDPKIDCRGGSCSADRWYFGCQAGAETEICNENEAFKEYYDDFLADQYRIITENNSDKSGTYCIQGSPNTTYYCRTDATCSSNKCVAYTYYRGCNGSGDCSTSNYKAYEKSTNCNYQKCYNGSCITGYPSQCHYCYYGIPREANTGWNEYKYGCNYKSRCSGGTCYYCNGFLYSDGCNGCAGQGGLACWHSTDQGESCSNYCQDNNFGNCVNANWNDTYNSTTKCPVLRGLDFSCSWGCQNNGEGTFYPAAAWTSLCNVRALGYNQSCTSYHSLWYRICVCDH